MKKQFALKIIIGAAMVLALFATPVCAGTMGNAVHQLSMDIAGGTELAKGVFWNYGYNDYVRENYLVYEPGNAVQPIIGYGKDLYGAASLQSAATTLTEKGYQVLAAINADFFNTATGVPIGLVMFEGEILSSESNGWETIGFKADGSAIIGQPSLKYTMVGNFGTLNINKINKEMAPSNGITLYTTAYSTTTQAATATYNIVVEIQSGALTVGGQIQGKVVAAQSADGAYPLSAGQVVISFASSGNKAVLDKLKSIGVGENLNINVSNSPSWQNVVFACGGSERLLRNGVNVASASTAAPRTALGVKGDGSFILYTVDGRQSGLSAGATMAATAARLAELGCVDAVNLDGGGSTTLSTVLPGQDYGKLTTINSPSGGALRSCGDYIFLVNKGNSGGEAQNIHFYPYDMLVLAGSTVKMSLKATDANYYPVALSGEPLIDVPTEIGRWENDCFYANLVAASGKITAAAGSAQGSVDVQVIANPDTVAIYKESDLKTKLTTLTLNSGTTLDLKAVSRYQGSTLVSSDTAYVWQVTGNIGIIDQNGVFQSNGFTGGVGTINISVGGKTASITVNVVGSSRLVEGFESNSGSFTATPGLTISACSDKTYVKYGAKALRFGYDFAAAPLDAVTGVPPVILSSPVKYNFSSNPGYLSFWVYGDKSANQLTFSFATPSGSVETMATVVDFTGWRGIAVAIPAEATGLSAVNLRGIGKGTLYLDHLLLSTSSTVDIQAPVINITGFGNTLLAATVRDAVDTDLISGNIKVLLDGKNQNFTYNSASGAVAATIMVNDANSHIISIIATDMSGNVGKTSYYIAADPGVADVFSDLNGHWVKSYGEYLYHQGIFSGIKDKNGLAFQPDSKLTRAQLATY
ncbi:MAG: phosphodiester glycosidase family protein [Clostridiales bacterium]